MHFGINLFFSISLQRMKVKGNNNSSTNAIQGLKIGITSM
jgi:hypothetical protein